MDSVNEQSSRFEDRLRTIVDTTPALIHTGAAGWLFGLFQSRLAGSNREAIRPVAWLGLDRVDSSRRRRCNSSKMACGLASGEPFEAEARVRCADGTFHAFLHRKVPLYDEHGNSRNGSDRASISRTASAPKNSSAEVTRSCKKASFISPKGSTLPIWEVGPSMPPASTTGLLHYFGFTASSRPARRLPLRNTWIASTQMIASSWQT